MRRIKIKRMVQTESFVKQDKAVKAETVQRGWDDKWQDWFKAAHARLESPRCILK